MRIVIEVDEGKIDVPVLFQGPQGVPGEQGVPGPIGPTGTLTAELIQAKNDAQQSAQLAISTLPVIVSTFAAMAALLQQYKPRSFTVELDTDDAIEVPYTWDGRTLRYLGITPSQWQPTFN